MIFDSPIAPIHPEFSVTADVRVGDILIVGGPGATCGNDLFVQSERRGQHSNLTEGDEVRVLEVEGQVNNLPLVRVSDGGSFWSVERFSLPGTPITDYMDLDDAAELAGLMGKPTKVVLVPDDVDVRLIPARAYDMTKGDRRFNRPDAALQWAYSESVRTGAQHVVRRCPGSYDFQELTLVQRIDS